MLTEHKSVTEGPSAHPIPGTEQLREGGWKMREGRGEEKGEEEKKKGEEKEKEEVKKRRRKRLRQRTVTQQTYSRLPDRGLRAARGQQEGGCEGLGQGEGRGQCPWL